MTPEELLSQLKDIHEPAAIGIWPLAPGWWISAITVTVVIAGIIYACRRVIKNNAWKKDAKIILKEIVSESPTATLHDSIYKINKLIKQIARYKLNDTTINSLTGDKWHNFLTTFLNTKDDPNLFDNNQILLLSEGHYRPAAKNNPEDKNSKSESVDITKLLKSLNVWLKEA